MTCFGTSNGLALSLASTVHRAREGTLPKSACIPAALRLARAQEVDVRRALCDANGADAGELFESLVATLAYARRLAVEVSTGDGLRVRYAVALFWLFLRVRRLGCRTGRNVPLQVLARALLYSTVVPMRAAAGAAMSFGQLLTGLVRRPAVPVPRFGVDPSLAGRMSLALVSAVVRSLPASARERYDEEFRAELADHGTEWSRFGYSIRLALRAWPLSANLSRRDEAVRNAMSGDGSAER